MKSDAGCGFAGCLFVVLVSLAALVAVRTYVVQPPPPEPVPEPSPSERPSPGPSSRPTPAPDVYREWVKTRGEFSRREDRGVYWLTYGFVDHNGIPIDLNCRILRADHEREQAAFGLDRRALDAELDARLTTWMAAELERRRLADFVHITFKDGGGYEWQSKAPEGTPVEQIGSLRAARDEWEKWMEKNFDRERDRIHDELLEPHGLRLHGNTLELDYEALAVRSTDDLANCAAALSSAAAGSSDRRALGIFIAFLQEIRYEVPPDRERGRSTFGLWVPTEVLANDHGDCDSKAVAFCALWRRRAPRVLLVTVPEHALVAVEGKPGPGDKFVRLGNRYYLLCEVAGPGKTTPGQAHPSGTFEYFAVPPLT